MTWWLVTAWSHFLNLMSATVKPVILSRMLCPSCLAVCRIKELIPGTALSVPEWVYVHSCCCLSFQLWPFGYKTSTKAHLRHFWIHVHFEYVSFTVLTPLISASFQPLRKHSFCLCIVYWCLQWEWTQLPASACTSSPNLPLILLIFLHPFSVKVTVTYQSHHQSLFFR